MVTATEHPSSMLTDYQLHLPQFEGPLDVLLRLIERSQLTINDLSLVGVTEQFLAYIRAMDGQAPPQVIAEFTAVGARLTLLKSRSLLPRPPKDEVDEDPSELTRQLEEYRRFKEMAQALAERTALGIACFGMENARVTWHDPQPARLARYEPAILVRVIRRRLSALPRPTTLLRQRPIVTLPQMVDRIISFFHRGTEFSFGAVLATCQGRSEAATAFLAMLVLHRRRIITARQGELFGEIRLARRGDLLDEAADIDGARVEADEAFAMHVADQDVLLAGANA